MKKKSVSLIITILTIGLTSYGQVQIGNDIDGEAAGDNSGYSTALSSDGSIAAIGAPFNEGNGSAAGHIRVFENISGTWSQIGSDIDAASFGDQTGQSVSLSSDGSIVAFGEPINEENGSISGQVRVFENVSGIWTQVGGDINGDSFNYQTGGSVDLSSDGSILAVGSRGATVPGVGFFAGSARVYENVGGTWTQIGSDIEGEAENDFFGVSLSLASDSSVVAIGALGDIFNSDTGYVNVYQNIAGVWTQIGNSIEGTAPAGEFGGSVSISSNGSIVAIGGRLESAEGIVRVFENIGGLWTQMGSDLIGDASGDQFGSSVSLSGDGSKLAVGARRNDGSAVDAGRTYIYENLGGSWVNVLSSIDGEAAGDQSGFSVSLSSDASTLAIGAVQNDANGLESGHVRVYDLSPSVSINEVNLDGATINLTPNPVNNHLEIRLDENTILRKVSIYNNSGQLLLTSKETLINVSKLGSGLYTVVIESNNGIRSIKIIKL